MNRLPKTAIVFAGPLMLAGCASLKLPAADPALNPANVVIPSRFAFAPDLAAQDRNNVEALLPAGDPAFAELRSMALGNGPDNAPNLAAALARVDAARALAAGASAGRLPYVGVNSNIGASRTNPSSIGGALPPGISIDRYRTSFGGNITASWDPDIFKQLRNSERAASIRVNAAAADAAAVRQSLIAEIAGNVTDWRTLSAREAVLNKDIATAQELLRLTRVRVKAGLSPGFDSVQAESLLLQAQAQSTPLLGERARIIGALVTLTGKPATQVMQSLENAAIIQDVGAASTVAASVPAAMLRARPDVAAAEARLAAADADIAVAAAARFPKLTLSGTLGLLAFALGDIFSADTVIGTLGSGIAAPLLDFGRIEAEIDGSKARAKEAFANYRSAVFTALGDAETAYGQTAASRSEITALERQRSVEKDAVYLAGIRYKGGLNDFRTVLNAQRQLNALNANIETIKGRHARARIALWLALGGS